MKANKFTLVTCFFLCFALALYAQQKDNAYEGKSVTLVTSGTADNEENAIKTALRSAIEQAFGTFVSANTQIVNDELTKDEIVSVTSGNIENYSLISSEKEPGGKHSVTVKATVSIGKLLQFAQSKGATTELAGATFAMNMKMRRLNKENEYQALCHMLDEMLKISELNLFDYSIRINEPKKADDELYGLPTIIFVTPNENYNNLVSFFQTTIRALSMSETEQKDYSETNEKYYKYDEEYNRRAEGSYPGFDEILKEYGFMNSKGWLINNFPFVLRNSIESFRSKFEQLKINIWKSSMSFKILDNIGNYSTPIHVIVRSQYGCNDTSCDWPIYIYENRGTNTYDYDIYGITSNHSFLGGASCNNNCGFPTIMKSLYYEEDEILINHILWPVTYNSPYERYKLRREKKTRVGNGINLIFCGGDYEEYHGKRRWKFDYRQSCLDLSGKTYPYFIYLYYNENEISKISSITIEPTNPKEIKTINR